MFPSASRRSPNYLVRILPTNLDPLLSSAARASPDCFGHVPKQPSEEANPFFDAEHPILKISVKSRFVGHRQGVVFSYDEFVVKGFHAR